MDNQILGVCEVLYTYVSTRVFEILREKNILISCGRGFLFTNMLVMWLVLRPSLSYLLQNEKCFELKSRGYRDGIKRKETR